MAYPKGIDDEWLMLAQSKGLLEGVEASVKWSEVEGVVLEGLSFAGKGAAKDKQYGIFWCMLTALLDKVPGIIRGKVPVTSWRAKVLTKEEQKAAKTKTDGLKKACVDKLPQDVREKFEAYVKLSESWLREVKGSKWKDCVYDLTDAYWMGKYRLTLT